MPLDSQARRQIAASLAQRAGVAATASQIADATVAAWRAIDFALVPIIGQRGVAALYRRSVHLTQRAHPCLAGLISGIQPMLDPEPLRSAMAQQSAGTAAAIGGEILQTFYELLSMLVGPSLTERLLRSVWADFLSGPVVKDI